MLFLLLLVMVAVLLIVLGGIYWTSKRWKIFGSLVEQGEMEFVVAGGRCIRVLENIPGYFYKRGKHELRPLIGVLEQQFEEIPRNPLGFSNEPAKKEMQPVLNAAKNPVFHWVLKESTVPVMVQNAIVKEEGDSPMSFGDWFHLAITTKNGIFWTIHHWIRGHIRASIGFYWVSIVPFLRWIHTFELMKVRPREGENEDGPLEENWIQRDKNPVKLRSLRWYFQRPLVLTGVEFQDRLQVDLGIQLWFHVVVPETAIFLLKGKFTAQIDEMVEAAVTEYCRTNMTLATFISTERTGPKSDFFAKLLSQLNVPGPGRPQGMIELTGIQITAGYIVKIVPKDDATLKALKATQLAELEGDADIMKEKKAAEALIAKTDGEARAVEMMSVARATAISNVENATTAALKRRLDDTCLEVAVGDQKIKQLGALGGQVKAFAEPGANASFLVNTDDGEGGDDDGPCDAPSAGTLQTQQQPGNQQRQKGKKWKYRNRNPNPPQNNPQLPAPTP